MCVDLQSECPLEETVIYMLLVFSFFKGHLPFSVVPNASADDPAAATCLMKIVIIMINTLCVAFLHTCSNYNTQS